MSNDWENEVIRKKDLIDWIQNLASAYQQLQYLYMDCIDYGKEITLLCAVADHVHCMKPAVTDKKEEE